MVGGACTLLGRGFAFAGESIITVGTETELVDFEVVRTGGGRAVECRGAAAARGAGGTEARLGAVLIPDCAETGRAMDGRGTWRDA